MKKAFISLLLLSLTLLSGFSQTDKIIGKWKTIDDKDGSAKSIVLIFKATNGKYYGKIEKLFKNPDKICAECEGTNKNKPLLGMMIINSMKEKDGTLTGGTILDPNNGKIYYCNINYNKVNGQLNVRGSLDKNGWIGRSQTWLPEQ
ncbi:MAG: DUF2147 domain-containing protein [Paludibacter sp.]|nr:DUF2147 domain-containing protein [Paludibacter sp.]